MLLHLVLPQLLLGRLRLLHHRGAPNLSKHSKLLIPLDGASEIEPVCQYLLLLRLVDRVGHLRLSLHLLSLDLGLSLRLRS